MSNTRIISKTVLPDLARTIPRPRLIEQVIRATTARVILITGQAAQGKSTLAANIARLDGSTGAWMHLDASDSDPANFFRLLVQALKTARPELDVSSFLKTPGISLGPESGPDRIVEQAGVFIQSVIAKAPVRLVLDGLDSLAKDADSLSLVHRIRDVIYPPSCLILVSRGLPPLELEDQRMRQELLVLDNAALMFSNEEITQFFLELHDLCLAPAQATRIRQITDGWTGGLVLAWEALSQIPEDQRLPFIDSGLPAAMRGDRLTYFSETVFSGLDDPIRHFLVHSAIFDTIAPKSIARYLGNKPVEQTQAILDTLVRRNLFIHPLFDAQTGWGYRYNQLFRDFLLDQFHTTIGTTEQQTLLMRAADLAWRESDFESAIRFFLQAQSYGKAAAGIKKIAMGLCAQGRFSDLAAWIDVLPDAMVQNDPWLAFYRLMGKRIRGGRKNIPAFTNAFDQFNAIGNQRGQLLALSYLIEAAIFTGHPATDLKGWLETAWTLLEKVSGNHYYPFAKATLWMQVAFGYITGAGDLQKGLSACRNAMLLANTLQDDILTVNATIVHVFGLTLSGEFTAAEKSLAHISHLVAAAYPEYRALRNIVRMKLALSQGNLEQAQLLQGANQEAIDRFGLLFLYPIHVDLSGLLHIHQQRFEMLGRTASHLMDVATLAANPFYSGLAFRLRALNAYHQGRFEQARTWAEKAITIITQSLGEESVHLYRCRLILGMVAYHLSDLPAARQALESACHFFDRVSSYLSLVEARLGLSLVATVLANQSSAKRARESALDLARAKGYEAFSILSAGDIAAACEPAVHSKNQETALLARRLVSRLRIGFSTRSSGQTAPISNPVQSVNARAFPPHLDIRTLGGFEVRKNGRVVTDTQWSGLRQKLLLKAIVVNGSREIPKDILMDALWPESGYEAALKRFKITLHRLRKILDPDIDSRTGASCILLKENRISLDMDCCRVDVNDFLAACDKVRQLRNDDDDPLRLAACRDAIDIYQGEFLPEEPYLSGAETRRAALKDQFIAVLMEAAGILEQDGELSQATRYCKTVIQVDPLTEAAYQRLMRLHVRQGQRSAALKVYHALAKVLATELDTTPDPATTRLYEKILPSD
ncbi:ATP-dependent transcriptional activator MalT [Desulfosarcina variabilis str. Montpellier]|uniref:BTAD domain-containing putative transcriptional regulator n=1 Tax=Desulfosarcina variabilis TaxID=2300 RepID=UPI003AFA041E